MRRGPVKRSRWAVVVLLAAGCAGPVDRVSPPASPPAVSPSTPAASPPASGTAALPDGCDVGTAGVAPRQIAMPGVVRAEVMALPRDENGVPGVPPLTDRGKRVFAWDVEQGVRPGDPAGNALLNAHTWPDGAALGNRLLKHLRRGDRIVVIGRGKRLCYRVTERVQVPAEEGLPRYYATDGPPQLAIVVCSGRRLGPGVWEKRTVWFASPLTGGR
jgi:hypothetical protein